MSDVDFVIGGSPCRPHLSPPTAPADIRGRFVSRYAGSLSAVQRHVSAVLAQPRLAVIIPAFDVPTDSNASIASWLAGAPLRTAELSHLWGEGRIEVFAARQYPMGHACDETRKWVYGGGDSDDALIPTTYRFGCEPYMLLSRRLAPRYDESFVGYGKDRVSFTYELAARGAALAVTRELFLLHHTTVQRDRAYAHSPADWMLGETCWPDFVRRVRARYSYQVHSCAQLQINAQVARALAPVGLHEPRCVSAEAGVCVGTCVPEVVVFRGGGVERRVARLGRSPRLPVVSQSYLAVAVAQAREPTIFLLGCDGCGVEAVRAQLELTPGMSLGRPVAGEQWWEGEAPHFFSQEDRYARGIGWYLDHYAGAPLSPAGGDGVRWVDASTSYLSSPFAAARLGARLGAHAPHHRLLIVLREPAELAWVLWRRRQATPRREAAHGTLGSMLHGYFEGHNFSSRTAYEAGGLSRCLASMQAPRHEPRGARWQAPGGGLSPTVEAWQQCVAVACGWEGCVVGAGMFAPQIRTWRTAYPARQMAVFTLRELSADAAGAAIRISTFVGVPPPTQASPDTGTIGGEAAAQCVVASLERSAGAAAGEAEDAPLGTTRLLQGFFARFSEHLRRELVALGDDLTARWPADAWLWAGGNGDRAAIAAAAWSGGSGEGGGHSEEYVATGGQGLPFEKAELRQAVLRRPPEDGGSVGKYTLPKLFLLGCEKCGSTSLAFALARHPQLLFAR